MIAVTIQRWTHAPWPSSTPEDRFTVTYTDPATGKVYRPATRPTELEARRSARAHGWAVEGDES